MTVVDATKLPDAPNIVCLSGSVAGEFRYTGKDGNTLLGVVKLPGTPNATWLAGTYAFRGIAAYDFSSLQKHAQSATVPDLLNRVLIDTDAAGNVLHIYQVYIPKFETKGLPQANLNGLEAGGFWMDKFKACMPDATNSSMGSTSPNEPGQVGAACMPHVVPWAGISGSNARIAIENRGGAANKAFGVCAALATASASGFYVENASHLIGKRVYITQNGVRYVRRVVRVGGNKGADANAAKRVEIYPALPEPITEADTYEILHHYLPGGYEWFSLWAWAHMHLYQNGLEWPKGNNNWGKDMTDPRDTVFEGDPDPTCPGYDGNAISRTLTGSGPLSWSLNGKESGIWDLSGNCWEATYPEIEGRVVTEAHPGAGYSLPPGWGYITELYAPAPDGKFSIGAELFLPKTYGPAREEYGRSYVTGEFSLLTMVRRSGCFDVTYPIGLAGVNLHGAQPGIGRSFRGVC